MDAAFAVANRAPQRIQSIALTWPSDAVRRAQLACPVDPVNQDAIWREPQVTAFAGRNDQAKMREIRLLEGQDTTAEAESFMRLAIARSLCERLSR